MRAQGPPEERKSLRTAAEPMKPAPPVTRQVEGMVEGMVGVGLAGGVACRHGRKRRRWREAGAEGGGASLLSGTAGALGGLDAGAKSRRAGMRVPRARQASRNSTFLHRQPEARQAFNTAERHGGRRRREGCRGRALAAQSLPASRASKACLVFLRQELFESNCPAGAVWQE